MTVPIVRPTANLPGPSDLIAGLADGTLVIGGLAGHEVAGVVKELMRRNGELTTERDALIRFYINELTTKWYKRWSALVNPHGPGVAWTWHESEAGAIEAIRRAVGFDKTEG